MEETAKMNDDLSFLTTQHEYRKSFVQSSEPSSSCLLRSHGNWPSDWLAMSLLLGYECSSLWLLLSPKDVVRSS